MTKNYNISSESVSDGHPDKLADLISDTILDEHLKHDKYAHVACETMCANNTIILAGEITSDASIDYEDIVKKVVKNVGYEDSQNSINYKNIELINRIHQQSQDIKVSVDSAFDDKSEIGAGDQGLVFGYATNETKECMPLPIMLAHKLMKRQKLVRETFKDSPLKPDAKSQVTIKYENDKPITLDTVVLSSQHDDKINLDDLRVFINKELILPVLSDEFLTNDTKILINTAGRFVTGGPKGDCGLTGRKIIVDTYGGLAPHGGGAFSGKDPTKIDRSAAYYARYVAKNIVSNNLADKCLIQVCYSIGYSKPVSIFIDTFETNKVSEKAINEIVLSKFDFRPKHMIEELDLLNPIYSITSSFGHFGRINEDFSWEAVISI